PALGNFEAEAVVRFGLVELEGLGLHVLDVDDFAAAGDEGDGEGDEGVFHPEAAAALLEDEQHAGAVRYVFAAAQAGGALCLLVGDFDLEAHDVAVCGDDGEGLSLLAVSVSAVAAADAAEEEGQGD